MLPTTIARADQGKGPEDIVNILALRCLVDEVCNPIADSEEC